MADTVLKRKNNAVVACHRLVMLRIWRAREVRFPLDGVLASRAGGGGKNQKS